MPRPITSIVFAGALLIAAAAPPAFAKLYKWVDADGQVHYSQSRPAGHAVERVSVKTRAPADAQECTTLVCRAGRLEEARRQREEAERKIREAAERAARKPVFPEPVKETDDEKIARLIAECKASRGSKCDSDEEVRRMLLQNVELTHAERQALRRYTPVQQRRILLQRIPKRYRDLD